MLFSMYFTCVNQETLLVQSRRFQNYLYSILVRLVEYRFFARFVEKRVFFFTLSQSLLEMNHSLIFVTDCLL